MKLLLRRRYSFASDGQDTEYFKIKLLEDGNLTINGLGTGTLDVSIDKINWTTITISNGSSRTFAGTTGTIFYLCGNISSNTTASDPAQRGTVRFSCTANFECYNNPINVSGQMQPWACGNMFNGCTRLVKAPDLPNTILADRCYRNIFYGCTSLTTAPELPATTIPAGAYDSMFRNCTSLVEAPELPATTVGEYSYSCMFMGCTSLVNPPEILPATILVPNCYYYMFANCSRLVKTPVLPAPALPSMCYYYMFENCYNLEYVKCLAIQKTSNSTSYWLRNVKNTGTFIKAAGMEAWSSGASGIPTNWTVIDDTEE